MSLQRMTWGHYARQYRDVGTHSVPVPSRSESDAVQGSKQLFMFRNILSFLHPLCEICTRSLLVRAIRGRMLL